MPGCLNNGRIVPVYDKCSLPSLPLHPRLCFHARHMYFYVLVGAPAATECGCRRRWQEPDFSLELVHVFSKLRIFRHRLFLPFLSPNGLIDSQRNNFLISRWVWLWYFERICHVTAFLTGISTVSQQHYVVINNVQKNNRRFWCLLMII